MSTQINIKAINPKYQSLVNKVAAWDAKYEYANDQRERAYANAGYNYNKYDKLWRKWDRACESAWDKYLTYLDELPKREQTNVKKHLN